MEVRLLQGLLGLRVATWRNVGRLNPKRAGPGEVTEVGVTLSDAVWYREGTAATPAKKCSVEVRDLLHHSGRLTVQDDGLSIRRCGFDSRPEYVHKL
jgi:hypothetical protein